MHWMHCQNPLNLSDEVLAWLSVWSEVQMTCIWSSWCHCHPIISASVKSRMVYPSTLWTEKKRGSTFDIITLENTLDFYNLCTAVSRKKRFIHSWKICPPHLNNVLTLPCESQWHFTLIMHSYLRLSTDLYFRTGLCLGSAGRRLRCRRYAEYLTGE